MKALECIIPVLHVISFASAVGFGLYIGVTAANSVYFLFFDIFGALGRVARRCMPVVRRFLGK